MITAHVKVQMAAGYSPCKPPVSFDKLAAHVPSWRKIIREVAEKYDLTPDDLTGPCRRRMYAWPMSGRLMFVSALHRHIAS